MEPRISIVTLGVADLARSRGGFQRLGFTASASATLVFFQAGGMIPGDPPPEKRRATDSADDPPRFGGITLVHNDHNKDNVDRLLAVAAGAIL